MLYFVRYFISKARNYVEKLFTNSLPLLPLIGCPCSYLNSLSLYTDFHPLPPHKDITPTNSFYLSYMISFCLPVFPCCVQTFPPNRKERKRSQQKQIVISFLLLIANLISLLPFIASFSKEFLIFPPSSVLVLILAFKQKNVHIVSVYLIIFHIILPAPQKFLFMLTSKTASPTVKFPEF